MTKLFAKQQRVQQHHVTTLLFGGLGMTLLARPVFGAGADGPLPKVIVVGTAFLGLIWFTRVRGVANVSISLVWLFALSWSVFVSVDRYDRGVSGMTTAALGFAAGWTLAAIGFPASARGRVLGAVAKAPLASVLLSVPLTALGRTELYENVGSFRLSGTAIPSHLAMLAFCGVVASIASMILGYTRNLVWIALNFAVLLATATRGAAIAAAIVMVFVIPSPRIRVAIGSMNRAVLAVVTVALGGAFASLLLARDTASGGYETGPINTSGRTQAWAFYRSVAHRSPLRGSGLGAASVANSTEHPIGVQTAFNSPHNELIHVQVDLGLVIGPLVLIVVLACIFASARKALGGFVSIGLIVAICSYGYVDNVANTLYFTAPMGLILAVTGSTRKPVAIIGADSRERRRIDDPTGVDVGTGRSAPAQRGHRR